MIPLKPDEPSGVENSTCGICQAIKGGICKLVFAVYLSLCAIILLIGVALIYSSQPERIEWTIHEVRPSGLGEHELGGDHWQWSPPAVGCTLLDIARADFKGTKLIDLKLAGPHHGYQCYYRFRLDDPVFAARLHAGTRLALAPHRTHREPDEAPWPGWWYPTESVSVEIKDRHETFFLNPDEPGICYTVRGWEWGD
jgi:hypothetical protein